MFLYTSAVSGSTSDYILQKINATAIPPTLITEFQKTINGISRGPFIIVMKNTVAVSYTSASEGNVFTMLDKNTLTVTQTINPSNTIAGVYMSTLDMLILH